MLGDHLEGCGCPWKKGMMAWSEVEAAGLGGNSRIWCVLEAVPGGLCCAGYRGEGNKKAERAMPGVLALGGFAESGLL